MKLFKKKCQCEKGFLKIDKVQEAPKRFLVYPPVFFVTCPDCGRMYKATKEGDKYIFNKAEKEE